MSKKEECPICMEESYKKYWVTCAKCNSTSCQSCNEKYLMDLNGLESKCMSCSVQWDYVILQNVFDEDILKKLMVRKAQIFMEREKSLLPQTQALMIEQENNKKNMERRAIVNHFLRSMTDLTNKFKKKSVQGITALKMFVGKGGKSTYAARTMWNQLDDDQRQDYQDQAEEEKKRVRKLIKKYTENHEDIKEEIVRTIVSARNEELYAKLPTDDGGYRRKHDENKVENKYIGHCPEKDCRGYLEYVVVEKKEKDEDDEDEFHEDEVPHMDEDKKEPTFEFKKEKKKTKLVCPLCDKEACKRCRTSKHKGKCDQNIVENVKALQKETKPCPKCKIPIYKIEGCDQMFCVSCHTAFSWSKGVIEEGRIHNPHYYEWLRKTQGSVPRERGDDPFNCNYIDMYRLNNHIGALMAVEGEDKTVYQILGEIHRATLHINEVDRPQYNSELNMYEVRVQYLKKEITEKQWLLSIKTRMKNNFKNKNLYNIVTMIYIASQDIFGTMLQCQTMKEIKEKLTELENLRKYINECFENIGKIFNHNKMIPYLDEKWKLNRTRAVKKPKKTKKEKEAETTEK